MNIEQFGKGALPDIPDERDYKYSELAGVTAPFDWQEGFDIERKMDWFLKVESQNGSLSCVGQSWAKYAEVLEMIENKNFTDLSAKDIYQRIFGPKGGAEIRLGGKLLTALGVNTELDVPSYMDGKPPTEAYMREFKAGDSEALVYKAKSYASVIPYSIDIIAQVIRDNNGCVSGFNGDNAGWSGAFVKPPVKIEWGHAVYLVGAKLINGKKYIKFINSWGTGWGEKGFGYFGEEYLSNMFSLWTLIDQINPNNKNMTNAKLIKRGQEIIIGLPITNPEALKSMAINFGLTVPLMPDGSVAWDKVIYDYTING